MNASNWLKVTTSAPPSPLFARANGPLTKYATALPAAGGGFVAAATFDENPRSGSGGPEGRLEVAHGDVSKDRDLAILRIERS